MNEPYSDGKYDLIVVDDFNGKKDLTFLNEFLGGGTSLVRIPGTLLYSFLCSI